MRIGIAGTVLLTVASLVRLRRLGAHDVPFKTPGNLRVWGRELPLGLLAPAVIVAGCALTMVLTGDGVDRVAGSRRGLTSWFMLSARDAEPPRVPEEPGTFDLLRSTDLSLDQVEARPGNVLVPVRNPHALAHVAAALQAAGDRDVVVMTVRLLDVDIGGEAATESAPTQVRAAVAGGSRVRGGAGRSSRAPADRACAQRRRCDCRHGSSSSLVRRVCRRIVEPLGRRSGTPAWRGLGAGREAGAARRPTRDLITAAAVQIPIISAHTRLSLSPGDLDLIHRVWLDAVKSVGPHVHHHDVVRAALTQMEHQLTGPHRDDALAAIRETARPADELAAALHARDYARLRDMMRNRHASDVAALLTELSLEDQVVVFRMLPRKDAAAVFEYLSLDAKEALLKAMAQEDVAALLNNMAPDDRTLFLEELPAAVTRQLLALLTPAERSVALTLLGYPSDPSGA